MNVFIIATLSADGFIAPIDRMEDASTTWSSKEDTKWFAKKTKEAGVCIMGRKSYQTIPKKYRPLKDRLNIVYTSNTSRITKTNLPLPGIDQQTPYYTNENPQQLIHMLGSKGYGDIAICGGSSVYTLFLETDVINKLYLTIEPMLFGDGVNLFSREISKKMNLKNLHRLSDQTTVMEYDIQN